MKRVWPQEVQWNTAWNGITIDESLFVSWVELEAELRTGLLDQLFADPRGYRFVSVYEREGWRSRIVNSADQYYCNIWFGGDVKKSWKYDGLVRVGNEEQIWQIYQRYSDRSYRRKPSRYPSIDEWVRA